MSKEINTPELDKPELNSVAAESDGLTDTPMLGEILRGKREEQGLSQQEIADRLRLRLAIVQSIEANDFQQGQVHTFTRGYIRSYAKLVGADESLILGMFDASDFASSAAPEQRMQSFSQKTQKKKHDNQIMKLTWGIFAVIVGISAAWWWQSEQLAETMVSEPTNNQVIEQALAPVAESPVAEKPVSPTPELVAAQPAAVSAEPVAEPELVAAPDSEMPAVVAVAVEEPAADAPENNDITATDAPAVDAPRIAMTFNGDCWIQISDATGKTLWTGVKSAGQNLELEGQGPFKFVLGAPEMVSLSISGEPFDLSRYTAGKVARFTAE